MATPHRLLLIVAAACVAALTAGIVIGHYALPAHGKAKSSSGGFYVSREETDAAQAMANVRAAVPALEAWNADHGTYKGATLEKLRTQYDYGLPDVTFVFTTRTDYCYESRVGAAVASKHGPGGEVVPQPCS